MSGGLVNLLTKELSLKNHYYIVRHGESLANVAGIVSSTYRISIQNHGLTARGREQAISAVDELEKVIKQKQTKLPSLDDVIFYASDFARAFETAYFMRESLLAKKADWEASSSAAGEDSTTTAESKQISADTAALEQRPVGALLSPRLYTHPSLRERNFGEFEGQDHTSYHKVWALDVQEPGDSNHYGAESIASVVDRTSKLIVELEQTWSTGGKHIVLVSHGDVCQILLTAFALKDPRTHRSIPHMKNCDVRPLLLGGGEEESSSE